MDKPMDKLQALKRYFGYDAFRPGQEKLVDALTEGRDALGIMPTGAGKSLCYQIPATLRTGITIVISPLISLMKDQVSALKAAGIPAAYLNSSLTPQQMDLATERARQGWYRIIYVAPERLETYTFRQLCADSPIALVAVDEAHCVSQWGQDFRPEYLRIADFVESLPVRPPLGAFTATATKRVREDILRYLRLRDPAVTVTGFDRPNLFFEVLRPENRKAALLELMRKHREDSGIIYCSTRKNTEEICDLLTEHGFSAGRYHAGLSDSERRQTQEDFQYDRLRVIVATNAFGMGIDKSNVNYVIHYNMPRSMEAYYQEAGRAGRDGSPAECSLLYSGSDIFTAKWMIDHGEPNPALTAEEAAQVRAQDHRRLQAMIGYCQQSGCLRASILRYFGESAPESCGNCGNCAGLRSAAAETARLPRRRRETAAVVLPKPGPIQMSESAAPADGDNLFELLRVCRLQQARAMKLPPYIVCDDRALADMARRKPTTREAMLEVRGMGDARVERYGEAFLQVIRDWLSAHAREALNAGPKHTKKAEGSPWQPEEEAILREGAGKGLPIREMARRLGRTENDVLRRLIRIKREVSLSGQERPEDF